MCNCVIWLLVFLLCVSVQLEPLTLVAMLSAQGQCVYGVYFYKHVLHGVQLWGQLSSCQATPGRLGLQANATHTTAA